MVGQRQADPHRRERSSTAKWSTRPTTSARTCSARCSWRPACCSACCCWPSSSPTWWPARWPARCASCGRARSPSPSTACRRRWPGCATRRSSAQLSPVQLANQIAEPLPVRSKDEFGQVTEAFNAVHLEAVRTAAEQAALRASVATMFVNLARRSQILVDRLIGHLDRLERGEEDPDRLAELFQLDHLATRMRRNDENLLVLAGADSTRVQREPAALIDVLRAAQSEVEHYTRIEFGVIDRDIEVAAHAVNDLVHLVAELFDNATAFSPPDSHGHGGGPAGRRPRLAATSRTGASASARAAARPQRAARHAAAGGRGRLPDDGPGRGRPAGVPARRQGRAAARHRPGHRRRRDPADLGAGAPGALRPGAAAARRCPRPGPASRVRTGRPAAGARQRRRALAAAARGRAAGQPGRPSGGRPFDPAPRNGAGTARHGRCACRRCRPGPT